MRRFGAEFGIDISVSGGAKALGGAVSVASDTVKKLKDALPSPLQDLMKTLGTEADEVALKRVNDFANTDTGKMLLRAGATGVFYTLAITGAPFILVATVFAIPGLLRGEPFDQAWITEFSWRVETTAKILGQDIEHKWSEELGRVVKAMKADSPEIINDMPLDKLAQRYNAREDITAYALSLVKRALGWLDGMLFDPQTGKRVNVKTAAMQAAEKQFPLPLFVQKYRQLIRAQAMFHTQGQALLGRAPPTGSHLDKLGAGQRGLQPDPPIQATQLPIQQLAPPMAIASSKLPYVAVGAGIGGAAMLAAGMTMPVVGLGALVGGAILGLLKK